MPDDYFAYLGQVSALLDLSMNLYTLMEMKIINKTAFLMTLIFFSAASPAVQPRGNFKAKDLVSFLQSRPEFKKVYEYSCIKTLKDGFVVESACTATKTKFPDVPYPVFITAAHCLRNIHPNTLKIRSKGNIKHCKIGAFFMHPLYVSRSNMNLDIAAFILQPSSTCKPTGGVPIFQGDVKEQDSIFIVSRHSKNPGAWHTVLTEKNQDNFITTYQHHRGTIKMPLGEGEPGDSGSGMFIETPEGLLGFVGVYHTGGDSRPIQTGTQITPAFAAMVKSVFSQHSFNSLDSEPQNLVSLAQQHMAESASLSWETICQNEAEKPESAYILGVKYLYGEGGLLQDIDKAKQLFQQAARKNHIASIVNLIALNADTPNNLPQEATEGLRHIINLSKQGFLEALYYFKFIKRHASWILKGMAE